MSSDAITSIIGALKAVVVVLVSFGVVPVTTAGVIYGILESISGWFTNK
jgi:hypothetical protein